MSDSDQNINKEQYIKKTSKARNKNQKSYFGNNLRLLQTLYQNKNNLDNLSQEKWAELTGLSRNNFRFWSTNRDTVPHFTTVKKIVDFFNQHLNLPVDELTPSMIVNENLTDKLSLIIDSENMDILDNITNEKIFQVAWEQLTLKHKKDIFHQAYSNLTSLQKDDLSIPSLHDKYTIHLEKLNIKKLLDKNIGFMQKIEKGKDLLTDQNTFLIHPENGLVINLNSESLSVYKQKRLSYRELTMASLSNSKFDTGTIKQTGVLKLFDFKDKKYIGLINIEVQNIIPSFSPSIVYTIKEDCYKEIDSLDEFDYFVSEMANIIKNNINQEIL